MQQRHCPNMDWRRGFYKKWQRETHEVNLWCNPKVKTSNDRSLRQEVGGQKGLLAPGALLRKRCERRGSGLKCCRWCVARKLRPIRTILLQPKQILKCTLLLYRRVVFITASSQAVDNFMSTAQFNFFLI